MENIVKLVSEKSGISEAQAKTAVDTVVSVLKDKMPGGVGNQVASFIETGKSSLGDVGEGLKDKMGGLFGK